jgi:glucose-1-phosphate cytidylyltransferase
MKVVLLAGGLGTRLSEETELRPKPMVEIGGRPILWHILKHYAAYDFKEFVIALGYKGDEIKRYFHEYHRLTGSQTVSLRTGEVQRHGSGLEDWTLHLMDTGLHTMTGGRVRRLAPLLTETFMVTYSDGVSNVDLQALLRFHKAQGRLATVTAVRPPARFGGLLFDGDQISQFTEKPQAGEGWINGGFIVFEPEIFSYLSHDSDSMEVNLLEKLAEDKQLSAYKHEGFWQCMDTLRDKRQLEALWERGDAPWKVWI